MIVVILSGQPVLQIIKERKWKDVTAVFNFPSTATNASFVLRKYYASLLFHYEQLYYFKAPGWSPTASSMSFKPHSFFELMSGPILMYKMAISLWQVFCRVNRPFQFLFRRHSFCNLHQDFNRQSFNSQVLMLLNCLKVSAFFQCKIRLIANHKETGRKDLLWSS